MITALLLASCALAQNPTVESRGADFIAAFEIAKAENRRVLVIRTLAAEEVNTEIQELLKNRAISRELLYEYAKLPVPLESDFGQQELFQIYPAEGAMLASLDLQALRLESGKLDGDKLLSFLKEHETEPWDAMEVLENARLRAVKENKRLFIDLSAPW